MNMSTMLKATCMNGASDFSPAAAWELTLAQLGRPRWAGNVQVGDVGCINITLFLVFMIIIIIIIIVIFGGVYSHTHKEK